jgi:S1-C subfamily serine protease
MRCPKCAHEQNNTVECDVCGVIFARYQKIQERRTEEEAQKALQRGKSGGGRKLLQVLLLVVIVAATTYYFTADRSVPSAGQPTKATASTPAVPAMPGETPAIKVPIPTSVANRETAAPRDNTIERARNATVSIETPWGTGSGFFINKNYIVTNRHVVQLDEKKLAEFRQKVETSKRLIELEQQKIGEMKQQFQKLPKGPSKSQLALIINAHEEELNKVLPNYQEGERRLAKLLRKAQPSDIKIILVDGSEHAANYLLISDSYDLALMSLFAGERTFIEKPPAGAGLHQGDKIYAIGSPVGLRHTVTAGIFSGFRSQGKDGQVYLQTDAAINPGNSGGPLIDENGYVRGVTTMILRETEGIGFAIPIEKVFEEFRSSLY